MRKLLVCVSLCAAPLAAQFLGYTLPQTTQQTLFTAQGGTQLCPAAGNVRNIGQSVHVLTYTPGGTLGVLELRLMASYDGTNYFPISESGTSGGTQALIGYGYFPFVCAEIKTQSAGSTVTINYTGTITPLSPYAGMQNSLTWKSFFTLPANTTQSFSISASGALGGLLLFQFSNASCAGSTISVILASPTGGGSTPLPATSLTATGSSQAFFVPSFPGTQVTLSYVSGCGASAATFNMAYGITNLMELGAVLNASGNVVPVGTGAGAASFPVDLRQVGGAAIALGQTTMANSIPVVFPSNATGASAMQVQGAAASGAPAAGNPVFIAGKVFTSGLAQSVAVSTVGDVSVASSVTAGDAASNTVAQVATDAGQGTAPLAIRSFGFDGTLWNRLRSPSLANFTVSSTLTARNQIGGSIAEKGSRWTVVSTPAVSVQASASIALEASVRHVADCVSFSAGSTTAPALTKLNVNLRDGASGAGSILKSWTVVISAATGQNVTPFSVCGLNLVGTTGTAMTLEFSSLLANLFEDVTLTGYNVN